MQTANWQEIGEAKKVALEVLLHNAHGPYHGLPRTAGWGYPEPYTRDLMFSMLGIVVSENQKLIESIRRVLETLAINQTERGHITSLVHDKENRGSSDTTPLFLLGVGIFRKATGEHDFLRDAVCKALTSAPLWEPGKKTPPQEQAAFFFQCPEPRPYTGRDFAGGRGRGSTGPPSQSE